MPAIRGITPSRANAWLAAQPGHPRALSGSWQRENPAKPPKLLTHRRAEPLRVNYTRSRPPGAALHPEIPERRIGIPINSVIIYKRIMSFLNLWHPIEDRSERRGRMSLRRVGPARWLLRCATSDRGGWCPWDDALCPASHPAVHRAAFCRRRLAA